MILWLLLGVFSTALIHVLLKKTTLFESLNIKKILIISMATVALAAGCFLLFTGRLHFIWVFLGIMVSFVVKLMSVMPYVNKLFLFKNTKKQRTTDHSKIMTRADALKLFGLNEGCAKKDIENAYKILMLKMHPDRGGSADDAAKVNQARDILLNEKKY